MVPSKTALSLRLQDSSPTHSAPPQPAKVDVHLSLETMADERTDVLAYFFAELERLAEAGTTQWTTQAEVVAAYTATL